MVQLTHIVAQALGAKGAKLIDYFPLFARPERPEHPPHVLADVRLGISKSMISQELIDDLREMLESQAESGG